MSDHAKPPQTRIIYVNLGWNLPGGCWNEQGCERCLGAKTASLERVTTPFMTKYERARILGTRALQIAMGAPVMIELEGETDPLEIVHKEPKSKIPLIVRR
ncbi:unnamed protein product [Gongylonema pulchrum]|uniref:DNA-directed RNA polymerase subunit K n=1 Tax=Gongylonema pulchrum TaxID=637853 RepID=A0A183E1T2_9BILA|nr:unnamed protein product [Gongylonema pulchrum]